MNSTATFTHYLELCKPRVVLLMIVTAIVGMFLVIPLSSLTAIPWQIIILSNLGIAFAASSAAVINHIVDEKIDQKMSRTHKRPIAQGKITPKHALFFSIILCLIGISILIYFVNTLTAVLTFLTLVGYAGLYSMYLKHATPQNIVIGGIAGAAPPLLGSVAITGQINTIGLLLMLIIFVWTPPHFWSLAIYRFEDYAKAKVPMLPNTHGIRFTKINILLYTILLFGITLLPYALNMTGLIYLIGALLLNIKFTSLAVQLLKSNQQEFVNKISLATFRYSIIYLFLLFVLLLIDHFI